MAVITAPKPMLCHDTRGDFSAIPADWIIEPKLDGFRWMMVVEEDRVRSYAGRNGTDHTGETPKVEAEIATLPVGTILDGEMIGGSYSATVSTALANGGTLSYVVFDVLAYGGQNITNWPWHHRRGILEDVFAECDHWKVTVLNPRSDVYESVHQAWLDAGCEGSVAKRPDSLYYPGKRSHDWVKCKPQGTAEAMITGFVMGKGETNKHEVGAFELEMLDSGVKTTCAVLDNAQAADVTANRAAWLGRLIEIRHHGIFPSGSPRHPVFHRPRPDLEGAAPEVKQQATTRRTMRMTQPVMRNYKAMGRIKLEACIRDLERGYGEHYDRALQGSGDPRADLEVAKGCFEQKYAVAQ